MILAAISVVCLMQIDEDDNDKDYGCLYTCLSCNVVVLYPIGGKLLRLLHIPDLIIKLYGFNL